MPNQQSKAQKETVERVMHEFKEGELRIGGTGPKVKNRRQAIAIALRESGSSNQESPDKNKSSLRKTKAKEARGETAEAETEGKRAQDRTLAKGGARAKGAGKSSGKSRSAASPQAHPGKDAAVETKSALYAEARRRDVPGRSRMSKDQLQKALGH